MSVARYLADEKGNSEAPEKSEPKVHLGKAAQCLGVDVRTLWNWRRAERERESSPLKKLGRPVYTETEHKLARWAVGRELRRQGYPGWLAVSRELRDSVPDRLIQLYVRGFKKKRSDRKKARILRHRVRVEVLSRDVIWGQDGTHVGRCSDSGVSVESQVVRDRGSLSIIGIQTGEAADHHEVLALLETVAQTREGYPLVWSRDNGSMYAHEAVSAHMASKQVIELRSLPRTPEHNGAAENTNREVKDVAELGIGARLPTPEFAHVKMQKARVLLNKNRVRGSKGLKTSDELDETLPSAKTIDRPRFYQICQERMTEAVAGGKTIRAGRLAEREAVFLTLEEFGLIKRTRGGKPYAQKPEIFL
jgi:transposase InsO family protein